MKNLESASLLWLSFSVEEWRALPPRPGVYRFYDKDGDLLYVGKANKLSQRVGNYFRKSRTISGKTRLMVKQIFYIMYTEVDSAHDALLLENNLIKAHQPKYNILLRDDKTYPYMCITEEPFPRLLILRQRKQQKGLYIGPYTRSRGIRYLREGLQRIHKLRNCNYDLSPKNIQEGKYKVCLEYHLGNCRGPCEGLQTESEYEEELKQAISILKGRAQRVTQDLRKELSEASSRLHYEEAQRIKDKLSALDQLHSRSIVANPRLGNMDVCTMIRSNSSLYINYMQIVGGSIIMSNTYTTDLLIEEKDEEIFALLLIQLRETHESTHQEILVNLPIKSWDKGLHIQYPKQGDKKKLVELSLQNLVNKQKSDPKTHIEKRKAKILRQLQRELRLAQAPYHIECFDISNLQSQYTVGVMVCFKDGKPCKKEYRHFHIRSLKKKAPDDYAAMREVIHRHYSRVLKEDKDLPQLTVIDGGKGQLSVATKVLKELNIKVPIIGLAKRLEEVFLPMASQALPLAAEGDSMKLLQQIRDETHRVAVGFHRKVRSKSSLSSRLNDISGIGKISQRELFKKFSSIKEIQEAPLDILAKCIGEKRALLIKKAL